MNQMISFMVLESLQMIFVRFLMQNQGIGKGEAGQNQD